MASLFEQWIATLASVAADALARMRPKVALEAVEQPDGFDLRRAGVGVRELVRRIEQALIDTLAHWQVAAERREGAPGVYVGEAKIAALGLRVRRGCSFHGLAFNVAMDLEPFGRINPCGYKGLAVTQLLDLGGPSQLADVETVLAEEFCRQFGFAAVPAAPLIPELPARAAV